MHKSYFPHRNIPQAGNYYTGHDNTRPYIPYEWCETSMSFAPRVIQGALPNVGDNKIIGNDAINHVTVYNGLSILKSEMAHKKQLAINRIYSELPKELIDMIKDYLFLTQEQIMFKVQLAYLKIDIKEMHVERNSLVSIDTNRAVSWKTLIYHGFIDERWGCMNIHICDRCGDYDSHNDNPKYCQRVKCRCIESGIVDNTSDVLEIEHCDDRIYADGIISFTNEDEPSWVIDREPEPEWLNASVVYEDDHCDGESLSISESEGEYNPDDYEIDFD